MRRVKKTTNEQFDLLKAEMAIHPAAARGYGVGAQRAVVDAEWKDIVEKLNTLGPPERTMTEWKKVWSDVRLRIKKQSMKIPKKPKKTKKEPIDPAEDQLMEALNSSISIYETHIKTEDSDNEAAPDYESYDDFDEEESKFTKNNYISNKSDQHKHKHNKTPSLQSDDEIDQTLLSVKQQLEQQNKLMKSDDEIEQTLLSVQQQLEQQNKLMKHLLQVSSNLTLLMKRHMEAEEKKTSLMQRQLKLKENHNLFLRRQEVRRKIKCINKRD